MARKIKYYLVAADALPEIFIRVAEAKCMMQTGEADTVGAATKMAGISRSAAEAGGACTVIENDCRSTLLFGEAFCGKLMTGPGSSGAGHFYRESNSA